VPTDTVGADQTHWFVDHSGGQITLTKNLSRFDSHFDGYRVSMFVHFVSNTKGFILESIF
jgi:hypothetical protein